MLRSAGRFPIGRSSFRAGRRLIAARLHGSGGGSEAGFLLVEVIISAMLVGLIVVATLQGFDVVNRTSENQRVHNEAAVLAAQSQESLRSLPASSLILLKASPHVYTQTVGGTVYTITQNAALLPAGKSSASCSVTESKRQSGNAFSITSTVSWPIRKPENRPHSLTASSIITPPTGSALEVDAGNAPVVTSGVGNIPIIVNYTPAGGGGETSQEQTTPAEGCVVFGGIPSTSALVEVGEVAGYVTRWGAPKFPTKEVDLAPNYTTHYEVLYNQGAAIKAEFAYKGSKTFKHYNNEGTVEESQPVTGDTFVTFNSLMDSPPDYGVGSTAYAKATTVYNPVPSTYEASATSPGNLFPFPESEKISWVVYPGDCVENDPETVTSGAVLPPSKVFLTPGGTTTVTVPTSYDPLNLYKGSLKEVEAIETGFRWKNLETTTARAVTITNSECVGAAGDDDSAVTGKHTQVTTTGAFGGHLSDPFQPFGGEFELCVYASPNTYTRKFENKAESAPEIPIYLGQRSTQAKAATKAKLETEEKETKTKRETAEKEAKTKREGEESTAKKKAEEKEASERKTWESEEKAKTIKKSEREAKEKTQKEAKTKRESEEATAKKKAEEKETSERGTKETAEKATETTRKNNEKVEAEEAEHSKVTVEEKASCP